MDSRCAALAAAAFALPAGAQVQELAFSGYFKSLLVRSNTVAPAGERYVVDLNRLRLQWEGTIAERATFDLQLDNELLVGDYVRTAQFAAEEAAASQQYWDLAGRSIDGGDARGRHRVHRASVSLAVGATDLRLGRQRIAWGTGRFWSPLDILNPIMPASLERQERPGVDALLVEHRPGALRRLSLVQAPRHDGADSSRAMAWHDNFSGTDYTIVVGRFGRERVAGMSLATQLAGAGLHAELTHSRRADASRYDRSLLGVDYAFPGSLTVGAEAYYDGAGAPSPEAYDFEALFSGRIRNVGRRYLAAVATYELTPLVRWSAEAIRNIDDRSRYLSSSLRISLKTDLDLTLGAQWFRGSAASEYGRFNDAYYVEFQAYY